MKKLFAILMSIMMIACFMPTMAFAGDEASSFDVTITLPQDSSIVKAASSGDLEQKGVTGEITTIVCNAAEGYYFPDNYASTFTETKGLSVTRESAGQIKISGTPTAAVTITLTAATAKTEATTPSNVSFVATGADTGKLTNLTDGLKYKIDGGKETDIALSENSTELELTELKACTISVIKKGGETTLDSKAHTIQVTKADKQTGIQKQDCSGNGKNDGKITGVNNTMEYQKKTDSAGTDWAPIEENATEVPNLTAGTYLVRVKATGNKLASEGTEVTITEPEAKPTISDEIINAISAYTGEYDGQSHDAIVVSEKQAEAIKEYTLKYKVVSGTETEFAAEMPRVTEVENEMPIIVEVSRDGYVSRQTAQLTPRITAKEVTYTIELEGKTYDGTAGLAKVALKAGTSPVTDDIIEADKNKVSLDLSNANAIFSDGANGSDAGKDKTVSITGAVLTGDAAANYKLSAQPTATATIEKAPLTIKAAIIATKTYEKDNTTATVSTVTFDGLVANETLTAGENSDYTATGTFASANAGEAVDVKVTVTLKENGTTAKNYTLSKDTFDTKGKIKKAKKESGETAEVTVQKGTKGLVDLKDKIAEGATTGAIAIQDGKADWFAGGADAPKEVNGNLSFKLTNDVTTDTGSNTATLTIPVNKATNYEDYEIVVKVTASAEKQAAVVIPPVAKTGLVYNGEEQELVTAGEATNGEMQYSLKETEGYTEAIPKAKDANDSYTVYYKVVKDGGDVTDSNAKGHVTVKIAAKPVTVQPKSFTIKQGEGLPTLGLEYVGLIGEDKLTVGKAYQPAFKYMQGDKDVTDPKEVGTYTIKWTNANAANFTNDNYQVETKETATLTIEAKAPSSGGSYYPYTPSTPSTPAAPNLDKTKADSTTALNTAASANKYDAAEQAEVKKILDKANADIKNAKTEAEVKAIEEAAQAEIDKILTTEEKAIVAALDNVEKRDFATKSKVITRKGGKKVIRLTWTAPDGVDVDGYEIFRSTKKNSGFGTKPYFETTNTSYTNTKDLKTGKTYYYKVRAFVVINGERVYTDYSLKANRKL